MRAVRALGVVVTVVVAGAVTAVPAMATFGAPISLSSPGAVASDSTVAVADNGDVIFVWRVQGAVNDHIQTRVLSAGGVLGPVQRISPAGSDAIEPEVAVDPDGDAVYTWTNDQPTFDQIQARARTAAGALSPTQDISPQSMAADSSAVAVDDSGDAIISWGDAPAGIEGIQTRARSAAGVLGPVQPVSPPANAVLSRNEQGALAVDADGDALYTWQVSDGANRRVQARARSAAGVLGRVRTLSAAGQDARDPQIAVEPDGDAVFTWARSDGTSFRVQARTRTAAGALGRPQTFPRPDRTARSSGGVAPTGDSVFSWERSDGTNFRVQTRARTAAGALSPVQTVSAAGQDASTPGSASTPRPMPSSSGFSPCHRSP